MTKEVCLHHVLFSIWIILGSVLLYGMINNINYAINPIPHYGSQAYYDAMNGSSFFWLFTLFFIVLNAGGLIGANQRYEWIRIKECPRK